jgi:hypothetical protein
MLLWLYIHTGQGNITQASYSPEYITPTQQTSMLHIVLVYVIMRLFIIILEFI